ncbi:MAG: hypothetical protein IMZ61_13885 [Planctomycetes bacterium]|nr:hypothetical protein [Chloroflexota bacterium]MBE3144988.1 hypothetical protein [Planctomycetota bacterium]
MNLQNTRLMMQREGSELLYPSRHVVVPNEELGVYYLGTTKLYEIGDLAYTQRGKYRYSYSSGICRAGMGNKFMNVIGTVGIDYSAVVQAQEIGDKTITMTSTVAQAADSLKGGTITINYLPPDSNNAYLQDRTVVGNAACAAGGTCVIALDYPLTVALTTASYAFVMPNPYSNIAYDTGSGNSVAGIPATYVSAAGYYFWLQTKGRIWIAPQGTVGATAYAREVVWRHDGSIDIHDVASATAKYNQHAGFILDNNASANGATEIFFDCDID